jgi:myosin heavy subunit
MRIATEYPQLLNSNLQSTATLPNLTQAIELLSASAEVKSEVMSRIESGDDVSIKEIRELKKQLADKDDVIARNQKMLAFYTTTTQVIEKAPADYEQNKTDLEEVIIKNRELEAEIVNANNELRRIKNKQAQIVSEQLKAHENEIKELETHKQSLEKYLDELAIKTQAWISQNWTQSQLERKSLVENGKTVVASKRNDANGKPVDNALIAWAEQQGLLIKIDRTTEWGNPFEMSTDGSRDEVCDNYANHFLKYKPSLQKQLHKLKGKVLVCWCYPLRCHGDHLAELANKQ